MLYNIDEQKVEQTPAAEGFVSPVFVRIILKEIKVMKHYLQTKTNENYDLFDAFNDLWRPVFFDDQHDLRTNIKETSEGYELELEMPGYSKEQIKVTLEQGYLTVSAVKEQKEEDKGSRYLRKEITESCQRSFYVGDWVTEEQIKAKYDNGILCLSVPKSAPKQTQGKLISIE